MTKKCISAKGFGRMTKNSKKCVRQMISSVFDQVLRVTDFTPSRRDLLEEMSLQAEVLDKISSLLLEKNDNISANDSEYEAQTDYSHAPAVPG